MRLLAARVRPWRRFVGGADRLRWTAPMDAHALRARRALSARQHRHQIKYRCQRSGRSRGGSCHHGSSRGERSCAHRGQEVRYAGTRRCRPSPNLPLKFFFSAVLGQAPVLSAPGRQAALRDSPAAGRQAVLHRFDLLSRRRCAGRPLCLASSQAAPRCSHRPTTCRAGTAPFERALSRRNVVVPAFGLQRDGGVLVAPPDLHLFCPHCAALRTARHR